VCNFTATWFIGNKEPRSQSISEVYRIHQYDLAKPAEIVLVARNSIKESGFCDVERDFLKALHKAGLLRDSIRIN
jgi:RNase P protein component